MGGPEQIFLPVAVLAFWTIGVLTLVVVTRFRAVKSGEARPGDFKYGESDNVRGETSLPNRDYMNLLELPVLFYVTCVGLWATRQVDDFTYLLAWAFVISRIIHSVIHLTTNNIQHRLTVFAIGVVIVVILLLRLALPLL